MADVYGPQQLLAEGLLPPALVQGHPGYLRAMHGVRPPGDTWLHIAAFDLARGPDGNWWVVSQRTQAPSGLGYLLREPARHLAPVSAGLRGPARAAPRRHLQRDDGRPADACARPAQPPHIALLTPGPYNETYFEHAYLARYLGVTLVEGNDLTVRDQRLYLKTLQGLRPVHGLHQAARRPVPRSARAARPIRRSACRACCRRSAPATCWWPTCPARPSSNRRRCSASCRRWRAACIGEKLQLPALPTWWCGERAAMEAVLPQLADCAIKSTYPGDDSHTSFDAVLGRQHGPARTRRMGRPHRAPGRRAHGAELPAAVADADLDAGPRPRPHRAARRCCCACSR